MNIMNLNSKKESTQIYMVYTELTMHSNRSFIFKIVTGFVKIDPNHTGTEIHFIAEH